MMLRLLTGLDNLSLSLLTLAIALLTFLLWRRKTSERVVGPVGLPIIGHLPLLTTKPHLKFLSWAKQYGPVYRIRMGSRPTFIVNGFEAVRQVLHTQSDDFAGRPDFFTFSLIDNGLSLAFGRYGPSWKPHKTIGRTALSMFTMRQSKALQEHIVDEADIVISELLSSEQPVDSRRSLHVATASVVFRLCYGGGKSVREDRSFLELLRNVDRFNDVVGAGNNLIDILPWTKPFLKWRMREFLDLLYSFHTIRLSNQARVRETWTPGEPRHITDALYDAADEAGDKLNELGLTKEHIYALVGDVIGAGQGTISSFLYWGILFAIEFEDVQANLHEEIERELGDQQPTYDHRSRLPYCEAFFLETQRFANTLPFLLPHAATKDCTLYGQHVPAGAMILCNMYSVLRDPLLWDKPDKFDPTRFLDPQSGQIDRAKSEMAVTFGMGKRRCMGEYLGRLESFIFLVRLMQRCDFHKDPAETYDLEGKLGFGNDPKAYKIRVTLRD